MHGLAVMDCKPRNRHCGPILFAILMTVLLNISYFYDVLTFHRSVDWLKAALVQSVEPKAFPPPVSDELLDRWSIIRNCSVMRIPSEWFTNNSTLVQLRQSIELRDCTKSGDIGQIFETRRHIINRECKSLGSKEKDLHRTAWTWQTAGINGSIYLDDRKNYRICVVPKAGSSSWNKHSKYLRKEHLQSINEVQILNGRHPFSRLVSAYNDKFCMGKLFTCNFKGSVSKFKEPILYGMWIPLLISSGRLKVNQDFYEALSNTIPLRGEGLERPCNFELLKIIQSRYSNNIKEIFKKFQGIVVPFKDFINHIFWTYRHEVGDHHWIPQTSLCDACRISWSYVLHLENIEEESKYMLREMGFKYDTKMSKKNVKNNKETPEYVNFFYEIPTSMIIKLVKYYYYDFLLLGYSL